jgi:hypothetical protein
MAYCAFRSGDRFDYRRRLVRLALSSERPASSSRVGRWSSRVSQPGRGSLSLRMRDADLLAEVGKLLFRACVLKEEACPLVGPLNPPIRIAALCNVGSLRAQNI